MQRIFILFFCVLLISTDVQAEKQHVENTYELTQKVREQLVEKVPAITDLAIGQVSFSMKIEDIIEMFEEQGFRHVRSGYKHQFDMKGQLIEPIADHFDNGTYIINLAKDQSIRSIKYKHTLNDLENDNKLTWRDYHYADQAISYMRALCDDLDPSPSDYFLPIECPDPDKLEDPEEPSIHINNITSSDGAVYVFKSRTFARSNKFVHDVEAARIIR